MTESVYIHVPFCISRCKYCSFVSCTNIDLKDLYLSALKKEIANRYKGELLSTLYLGGGTPSLLKPHEISEIILSFNINSGTEITVEINPETVDYTYLTKIKQYGVNRLSFGCQTFDDKILKIIGRRHTSNNVVNIVKIAQDCGFNNISLDFIYGLPEQTIDIFEADLLKAIGLNLQHISLYGLKIDSECYFYNNMPTNIPNEDLQADMYLRAVEILQNDNYNHYEISNFSKQGFESRHNLNYWNNNSYYGFGAAAHGYENDVRYSNKKDLSKYIENPLEFEYYHKLSPQEQLEEEIFLGFRKGEGINLENINYKYKINFENKYGSIIKKYSDYIIKTPNGYSFNNNGFLISNLILSEFIT